MANITYALTTTSKGVVHDIPKVRVLAENIIRAFESAAETCVISASCAPSETEAAYKLKWEARASKEQLQHAQIETAREKGIACVTMDVQVNGQEFQYCGFVAEFFIPKKPVVPKKS